MKTEKGMYLNVWLKKYNFWDNNPVNRRIRSKCAYNKLHEKNYKVSVNSQLKLFESLMGIIEKKRD